MRGDVHALRAPPRARGHEQQGRRFAIIVQARRFVHLSTVLAIPTSASAGPAIYRPEIEVPDRGSSRALCEALTAIDPEVRLGDYVGTLTYNELQEIDAALRLLLDLDP